MLTQKRDSLWYCSTPTKLFFGTKKKLISSWELSNSPSELELFSGSKKKLISLRELSISPSVLELFVESEKELLSAGALQILFCVADDVGSSHVNPCVVDQRLFPGGGQIPASSLLKRIRGLV